MSKGIVMEITGRHVIVMTPKGEFIKVSRKKRFCQIGEEIQFSAPAFRWRSTSMRLTSALSAAVVLGVVVSSAFGIFGGGSPAVAAYVTLDINPSVELAIDADEDVLLARGINEDGKQLLESLKYKGEKLDNVTEQLMEKVEQQGYLTGDEADIVITSTVMDRKPLLNETAMIKKVELKVQRVIKLANNAEQIQVAAFTAPPEVRKEAVTKGVSTGKLTLRLLVGKRKGEWIPINELKTASIHELAKEAGGLDQFIHADKPVSKGKLKKMLEMSKHDIDVTAPPEDQGQSKTTKTGNGNGNGKSPERNKYDDDVKINEKANGNQGHGNGKHDHGYEPDKPSGGEKEQFRFKGNARSGNKHRGIQKDDDFTGQLQQEVGKVVPDIVRRDKEFKHEREQSD